MAISLQKGGNVNLSKEAPSLTQLHIGLVKYVQMRILFFIIKARLTMGR